jgi:hypothetical protein
MMEKVKEIYILFFIKRKDIDTRMNQVQRKYNNHSSAMTPEMLVGIS